jgi:Leucine-rich repeat (LRR) protein|tara:strand:+ start:795 stop:968 length:174 start_codon:yes stop_codon:yes gene_type:complete
MLSLQSLDLTINQIEALPAEFGMLTCLQDLNLRTNKLKDLPPEVSEWSEVKCENELN